MKLLRQGNEKRKEVNELGSEKLFRVGVALSEIYKHGEAIVLIGETFHSVGKVLDCLGIEYKFEASSGNYNRIYL